MNTNNICMTTNISTAWMVCLDFGMAQNITPAPLMQTASDFVSMP